jgi:hypothetical protein
MITRYKFLRKGMKSQNGDIKWRLNRWEKATGELSMCNNGFHCSKEAYQAFSFIHGEILTIVECRGEHLTDEDKECWREQRVVKAYKWTKRDSVKLAIFSAGQVLKYFEKYDKKDKRPREAIEAAKKWLRNPTAKNRHAADAAYAAANAAANAADAAAYAAADAAYAAANAADTAAYAAYAAADAAAYAAANAAAYAAADAADTAAYAAANAADTAAYAAARKKMIKLSMPISCSGGGVKIIKYFDYLVKHLKRIK